MQRRETPHRVTSLDWQINEWRHAYICQQNVSDRGWASKKEREREREIRHHDIQNISSIGGRGGLLVADALKIQERLDVRLHKGDEAPVDLRELLVY